jgi:hypothetical protein
VTPDPTGPDPTGPDPTGPELTVEDAVAVVGEFLDAWEPPRNDEWVVTEVRPFAWGWAVSWANRRYAEGSREPDDVYRGSGPYLVDRLTGAVALAGSAHPVEHYVALWRSGQWPEVATR